MGGGWGGGQKAAGRKLNKKDGQKAKKCGIMARQNGRYSVEELSVRVIEECKEFLTAEVTREKTSPRNS